MKKYFITGLVILLPVTLTLLVVFYIFNLLTEPFLEITRSILDRSGLIEKNFLFLSAHQVQTVVSKILILAFLFLFTVLLGAIARWFFIYYLIRMWEYMIHRIPFVSPIYKACQDVIKTIFASKSSAFKQVVMVPFPNKETLTIGLLTREGLPGMEAVVGGESVVVFVPTTPNPTSGFLVVLKKSDVVPLEMKVEDALKYVISCGVVMVPFKRADRLATTSPDMPVDQEEI